MAAAFHWAGVGFGAPRLRAHAYRREPAIRKRADAMRRGGIVSMAKRMARYVDPHTTYTTPKAPRSLNVDGSAAGVTT